MTGIITTKSKVGVRGRSPRSYPVSRGGGYSSSPIKAYPNEWGPDGGIIRGGG